MRLRGYTGLTFPLSPSPHSSVFPVPFRQIGRRVVGALQELHQRPVGVARGSHGVVGHKKLAQLFREKCLRRIHFRRAETLRRRIGVGIERRIVDGPAAARPEAGTRNLVRIGLLGHGIRQMRHTARMARRRTAGKARHRQIEAAPEEMHRTRLAEKAGAEMGEDLAGGEQHAPETVGIVGIIGCVHRILLERNAIGDLARHRRDVNIDGEFAQRDRRHLHRIQPRSSA